jgi:hypothetical protein
MTKLTVFHYDEEPLDDKEFHHAGAFVLKTNDMDMFCAKLEYSLSIMDCCKNCRTVVGMRRALIVGKLFASMTLEERADFLTKVDKVDMSILIKYCSGFIDCEDTLNNIENGSEHATEYNYLVNMNIIKHIYSIQKRYWSDE